jgi:hypothetical protein
MLRAPHVFVSPLSDQKEAYSQYHREPQLPILGAHKKRRCESSAAGTGAFTPWIECTDHASVINLRIPSLVQPHEHSRMEEEVSLIPALIYVADAPSIFMNGRASRLGPNYLAAHSCNSINTPDTETSLPCPAL